MSMLKVLLRLIDVVLMSRRMQLEPTATETLFISIRTCSKTRFDYRLYQVMC